MNGVLVDSRVDLRPYDEAYANEVVSEQEPWNSIPDGRYEVRVDRVELTQSKSSGNPMLKWTLRILGATFQNRLLWKYRAITENTLKYVKQDLWVCGLELPQFSALPSHLSALAGLELEITKISRGEDSNIIFNRRLGSVDQGDGGVCDDDIPF
ncbi:MAG: DUF669 domain-containing protein [Acidobacteriota bacterium]|jgi:hypothetical protein|nr:DUF669 domain-containing protein [Bryobacteraceae bacterium CoA2 C42]MCA2962854.1 DUF669 domain-containing protein [Acidobacteriaceae bacterium]